MNSWIRAFVAGALLGVAVASCYSNHSYRTELDRIRQQAGEWRAAAESAENGFRADDERLHALEELLNRRLAGEEPSAEAAPVPEPTPKAPDPVAEQKRLDNEVRKYSEKVIKRGVERWTGALSLSPEQAARFDRLLHDKLESGKAGDFYKSTILHPELLQVLTPSQKAEFDHIQDRESQAKLELRAQLQLARVQSIFDLSESQKDQLFQKFSEMERVTDPRRSTTPAENEQRVQAVQGILTPDQVRQYQKALQTGQVFQGR